MINIALHEPEMPANTGNIGRSCLLTSSRLHLIRPFPFHLDDKSIRRSGLDYWKDVDLVIHDNYSEFLKAIGDARIFFATTKADKRYDELEYRDGDFILFGKESKGLPEEIINSDRGMSIRIPMIKSSTRSLNLSNCANIILFEALRQLNFPGMR
ncbi:MAG: tRNA (cytidine(34)-2'-O)-methyltransferase [Tissierellia bacterium]|nr:tRNA (cytidine(34)-2'-O)-methyltransferase [Tissierellia bacterium]